MKTTLVDGLKKDGKIHAEVELKDLTVGDIMDANEAAEKLVTMSDGKVDVAISQTVLSIELLRRRIAKLGTFEMPISVIELRLLSSTDYDILQDAIKKRDLAKKVSLSGRSEGHLSRNHQGVGEPDESRQADA